jgi:predicted transcriptional regulator of viral defense system
VKTRLGRQEAQLLAYVQMRKKRTVRSGELRAALRLTAAQERELFRRLARGGLIARVRPGLYLVPPRLPLGGSWSPDEGEALEALLAERGGRYQVVGPNAFNRYGFDEQVPARVYAYNDRISGERSIGSVVLNLIKVAKERLGDTEEIETVDGGSIVYASRVRTLVDAVYDWARFGSLPRGYAWICGDLRSKRVTPAELVRCTLRYGDVGTIRRMGALLTREKAAPLLLRRLERTLSPTTGLIPFDPTRPKRGERDLRWGVVWNERE